MRGRPGEKDGLKLIDRTSIVSSACSGRGILTAFGSQNADPTQARRFSVVWGLAAAFSSQNIYKTAH